jgi:GNAT superfamily N-acetyltransferase
MGNIHSYFYKQQKLHYKYIPSELLETTELYYIKCLEIKSLLNTITPNQELFNQLITKYNKVFTNEDEDYDTNYISDILDPHNNVELPEHNSMAFIWIDRKKNDIIGFSLLDIKMRLLYSFMISEEYQHRGFGTHFLAYIIKKCYSIFPVPVKINIEIIQWNYKSINFFTKNGFIEHKYNDPYHRENNDVLMYYIDLGNVVLPTILPNIPFKTNY